MLRKLAITLALAGSLAGCAEFQKLENLYQEVEGATIPPRVLYLAVNAFDAAKATATQYANYCRPYVNLRTHRALANAPTQCSDANRRLVIKTIKAGTAARNQAETYLSTNTPAPRAVFDTLKAAVDSLQASGIAGAQ